MIANCFYLIVWGSSLAAEALQVPVVGVALLPLSIIRHGGVAFSKSDSAKFWLSRKIYRKNSAKSSHFLVFVWEKGEGSCIENTGVLYIPCIRTFFQCTLSFPVDGETGFWKLRNKDLPWNGKYIFSLLVYFTIHYIARHTHFPCTQHSKKASFSRHSKYNNTLFFSIQHMG